MSSNPCNYVDYYITWITGVETTKRQTRAAYDCLVAGKSPWAWARIAACGLYARSVCDTKALLQLRYVALGAI